MRIKWLVIFLFALCIIGGPISCSTLGGGGEDFSSENEGGDFSDEEGFEDDEGEFADEGGEDDFGDEFADEGGDVDSGDEFADEGGEDDFGGEFADEGGEDDFEDEFADEGGDVDSGDEFADEGGEDDFGDEFADEGEFGDEEVLAEDDLLGEDDGNEMAAGDSLENESLPEPEQEMAEVDDLSNDLGGVEGSSQAMGMGVESPAVEVTNISFRAAEAGGTVVIETTGQANYQLRPKPETGQYVVEVMNATLPQKLMRPLITKEFTESQIGSVNAYQSPGSKVARVVVQMKGSTEPSVRQEGNLILISGSMGKVMMAEGGPMAPDGQMSSEMSMQTPAIDMTADTSDYQQESVSGYAMGSGQVLKSQTLDQFLSTNERFYGKKISIETENLEVSQVLKLIAEESGLNLVVSADVKGTVNLKLRDVPWDQALVVVLRSQRLGYHRQGNVLRVAPLKQLREEVVAAKTVEDEKKKSQPLVMKVMAVSYNDVTKLMTQVQPFLSERGKIAADTRTSSIVVSDIPSKVEIIEKLIRSLDIAPPQVLIEAKVIEASDNFTKELGVNWSFSGDPLSIGENNGADTTLTPSLTVDPTSSTVGTDGLIFNLSAGTLSIFGDINARLAIFERQEKIKVLSSPRVTTLTNEKAVINQKTEIPLITTTVNGEITTKGVSFKDVNLKMEVTPQVTADESIILNVDILREFAGGIVDSETQARPINSRAATTRVLVQNGQTAVIGGVYQSDATETETGVPYLRKIPILGRLFESRSKTNSKNELMIFITPRVLGKSISATN